MSSFEAPAEEQESTSRTERLRPIAFALGVAAVAAGVYIAHYWLNIYPTFSPNP